MASRQRSFFDKQKSANRNQWNKPRKPQHVNRDPETVVTAMSAPAIAASSASKAKLKAFSFVGTLELSSTKRRNNDGIEDDKENNNRTFKRPKPTTSQSLKLVPTPSDAIEDEQENNTRTARHPKVTTSQKLKTTATQTYNVKESEQKEGPRTVKSLERSSSQKLRPMASQRLLQTSQKSPSKHLSQKVEEEHREYPQTPLGRVPLVELINDKEDILEQAPSLTPIERIIWNHSPQSSNHASDLITPVARRGKKRARSSSPISSSQNDGSAHSVTDPSKRSFDLQTLQRSLRTPQADPANDLWCRYSFITADKTTPAAPAIADFLHSSSPQTPAHNGRGLNNGLRRSLSCSVEWPTSVTKRQKIYKSHSQITEKTNFAVLGTESVPNESRISRVSLLLEKVQEGLVKNTAVLQETSLLSSSQISCGNRESHMNESPLARLLTGSKNLPESSSQPIVAEEPSIVHCSQQDENFTIENGREALEKESSSEFGDDEIDFEFFEEVDAGLQTKRQEVKVPERQGPRSTTYTKSKTIDGQTRSSLSASRPDSSSRQKLEVANSTLQSHQSDILEDFDEDLFDNDDSDLFAADLEVVAALYDQQPHPNTDGSVHDHNSQTLRHHSELHAACRKDVVPPDLVAKTDYVEVSSDNEFGDDLDFERIAVEYDSATQVAKMGSQGQYSDINTSIIQRYHIVKVSEELYRTKKGHVQTEKILVLQEGKTKLEKIVILRQSWVDTAYTRGSYVHVLGRFDKDNRCIIDDAQNMIILHPDHLISSTVVADSFTCIRRAVLQDRVKATNESNEPQVYGHILHELFQEAMKSNRWDSEWLMRTVEDLAARYLETLFEINVETTRAIQHLASKVPELQAFAELFVNARPKPDATVRDRNGAKVLMSINKLLDVEEHVWSPIYGLKGNVDATVQVVVQDGNNEKTLTVPFELKTGKNSNTAHKAQTALYTLLLSGRYDVQIAYGILYYMETSELSRIPAIRHELRHMIIQRNELACYVRQRLELPPMLKNPHLCGRCYAQTPCFVYHKLVDNGDGNTSGLEEKFDEVIQHLKPIHEEFFKKWDDLITKEETDVLKFRREIWTMLSLEREKVGRCFAQVVIEPGSALELSDAPKINRFRYNFIKQNPSSAFSFTESQITVGEPIVISDEKGHFALANGYVTKVRPHRISVAVDRRLHNARVKERNFNAETNQSFTGIMEVAEKGKLGSILTPKQSEEPVVYRLDKDEFSNGMATVRNNLLRIMEKDLFGAQPLRRLIVEGVPPTFRPPPPNRGLPRTASQASLNIDQKNAIDKVMTAKDYALVLGMPGTGKTTTIAHIIRALAAQGKSILLTSYTHTAVDNILLKIRNDGIGIFRLGAVAKVHPEIQEFADLAGVPKTTVEELKKSYNQQIVATTCLGVNHPIFSQRIFDYCIVDEASQITLPVCLGPIRMAQTFILVGDHYQLPPLVQNKEALEGGLDVSLFKLLSDKHPTSVVTLQHQYRMCEEIMTLSNTLIYEGRLKCGNSKVASSSISIPRMDALKLHHHPSSTVLASGRSICQGPKNGLCWIQSLLNPVVKVAFINTDPLLPLSQEIAVGSRITNPIEAVITTQLVESLITIGVKPTDIGIITLYRSQLALLKQNLRHRCTPTSSNSLAHLTSGGGALEMHTADKFQGRDKEVVVLSLVRSNETTNVGDLLKDWRRVNVALTRARTKLLIIGSAETMRNGNDLLCRFVDLVEKRGWRYDLYPGALEEHLFEEGGTQATGDSRAKVKVEVGEVSDENEKREKAGKKEGNGKTYGYSGAGFEGRFEKDPRKPGKHVSRKMRMPEKTQTIDVRNMLGRRPVLRNIINEVMG